LQSSGHTRNGYAPARRQGNGKASHPPASCDSWPGRGLLSGRCRPGRRMDHSLTEGSDPEKTAFAYFPPNCISTEPPTQNFPSVFLPSTTVRPLKAQRKWRFEVV